MTTGRTIRTGHSVSPRPGTSETCNIMESGTPPFPSFAVCKSLCTTNREKAVPLEGKRQQAFEMSAASFQMLRQFPRAQYDFHLSKRRSFCKNDAECYSMKTIREANRNCLQRSGICSHVFNRFRPGALAARCLRRFFLRHSFIPECRVPERNPPTPPETWKFTSGT